MAHTAVGRLGGHGPFLCHLASSLGIGFSSGLKLGVRFCDGLQAGGLMHIQDLGEFFDERNLVGLRETLPPRR